MGAAYPALSGSPGAEEEWRKADLAADERKRVLGRYATDL
jgi:hypothetical protein